MAASKPKKSHKLGKNLKRELSNFLEHHPPKRVNRHLRTAFFELAQNSANVIPSNMDEIIWDLSCLMELLDVAEDEYSSHPSKKWSFRM